MLGHRLRCWPDTEPALAQCIKVVDKTAESFNEVVQWLTRQSGRPREVERWLTKPTGRIRKVERWSKKRECQNELVGWSAMKSGRIRQFVW